MTNRSAPDAVRPEPRTQLFWYLGLLAGLSLVFVYPAASWLGTTAKVGAWGIFSSLALLYLAGLLVGGLLGLLFAVPRSLWGVGYSAPLTRSADAKIEEDGRLYRPNSNLEEISDWFTKILVGVLLINVDKVAGTLGQFAQVLGSALSQTDPEEPPRVAGLAGTIALTLLIFAVILGFLWGYLWSRLHLLDMFTDADRIKRQNNELHANQRAWLLFNDQLTGRRTVPEAELKEVLAKVNKTGQDTVYFQARDYLESNLGNPEALERVIPLYQVLAQNEEYPNNKLEYAAALAAADATGNVNTIREQLEKGLALPHLLDDRDEVTIRLSVLRAFVKRRPADRIIRLSLQHPALLEAALQDDLLLAWITNHAPDLLPKKGGSGGSPQPDPDGAATPSSGSAADGSATASSGPAAASSHREAPPKKAGTLIQRLIFSTRTRPPKGK